MNRMEMDLVDEMVRLPRGMASCRDAISRLLINPKTTPKTRVPYINQAIEHGLTEMDLVDEMVRLPRGMASCRDAMHRVSLSTPKQSLKPAFHT